MWVQGAQASQPNTNPSPLAGAGLVRARFAVSTDAATSENSIAGAAWLRLRNRQQPSIDLSGVGGAPPIPIFRVAVPPTRRHTLGMNSETGAKLQALFAPDGGVPSIFGRKVVDYVASRPDYPAALFAQLRSSFPPPANVADVGSGTGLLTRDLLRHGYRVVAVEPNEGMRRAGDQLLHDFPDYRSVPGSAESIPLPDASVQLVTAAQAFHWFDLPRARRECQRVLTRGGLVALIWNERVTTDPLQSALDVVLGRFGGEKWRLLGSQEQRAGVDTFFGHHSESFTCPHDHALDREGLRSLIYSRSYIPARDTPAGVEVAAAVDELFDRFCPARKNTVLVRYETIMLLGSIQ